MQKRHHTVPLCYLENFTDSNGHVWVLDVKDNIFNTNPENILVESNFYTITLKNGEKSLLVEDTLANIESSYGAIFINKISKNLILTAEERATVAIFIAALLLRTKSYREANRNMFQKLKSTIEEWEENFKLNPKSMDFLYSAIPSDGESINKKDVEEYLKNYSEQHSVSIISQLPEVAQIIFNMKWSILESSNNIFVTCDNPVTLLRPESIKKYGKKAIGSQPGLLYKDIELTIPLSKNKLLLAGWILENDSYLTIDDEVVANLNHRTISSSSERVITKSKQEAEAIRDKYTETAYKSSKKKIS